MPAMPLRSTDAGSEWLLERPLWTLHSEPSPHGAHIINIRFSSGLEFGRELQLSLTLTQLLRVLDREQLLPSCSSRIDSDGISLRRTSIDIIDALLIVPWIVHIGAIPIESEALADHVEVERRPCRSRA